MNEWFAGGVETPFGGYGKSGKAEKKDVKAVELRPDKECGDSADISAAKLNNKHLCG